MTEHKEIWLAPACHTQDREWCQDNVWGECEDCGEKAVRYMLAEDHDASIDTLHEEIATREAERDVALDQIKGLKVAIKNALDALASGDMDSATDHLEEALSPEDEA